MKLHFRHRLADIIWRNDLDDCLYTLKPFPTQISQQDPGVTCSVAQNQLLRIPPTMTRTQQQQHWRTTTLAITGFDFIVPPINQTMPTWVQGYHRRASPCPVADCTKGSQLAGHRFTSCFNFQQVEVPWEITCGSQDFQTLYVWCLLVFVATSGFVVVAWFVAHGVLCLLFDADSKHCCCWDPLRGST